ncbi:Zinc finger protein 1 [Camellia lanceoleosa]|uniref:Zinc finger protein 1 n=1 Tax=Camellia lanceoleosa TaxID=1840588 RepID=A0ACC0ILI7_9ERIC|nr:Zinc finger protein 1 [Camellia lanceoleosa]
MEAVGGGAEQNPSESSRIFEGPPLNDRDKMNMMKGKGLERGSDSDFPKPPKPAGSHLLLDLKLSNEELNLLKPSKAGSFQASDIESPPWSEKKGMREKKKKKRAWEEEEVPPWSEKKGMREKKKKKRAWEEEEAAATRVFSCNFCKRKFPTSKAVAGHQNGHKEERALLKSRQGMMDNVGVEVGIWQGGLWSSLVFVWPPPFISRFESSSSSSTLAAATNNATTDDGDKNLWPQLSCSESDPSYDPSGLDLNLKL